MRAAHPCVSYTHPHPNPPGLQCRCPGFCKHCGFTEAEHNAFHFGNLARQDDKGERRQGMTREEFDAVMDRLVSDGLLVINSDGTYSPTPAGRAVNEANQPGKAN